MRIFSSYSSTACLLGGLVVSLLCGCGNGNPPAPESPTAIAPETAAAPTPTASPTPAENTSVAEPAAGDLWSRLQQAERHYFVLIRHAIAPGTGDPANFQLDDCSTQRNLSAAGRAQAQQLGEAFKQRGIAVQQVLSSQWCRCLETAELMALGSVEPFPPLNSFFRDRSTAEAQTAQVREFMLAQADEPGVTVMVTHFVNIAALSDRNLSSGAMLVVAADEQELTVLGQLEAP